MNRTFPRLLVLIAMLALLQGPAWADGASAVQGFFKALQAEQYATAWSLLSDRSQTHFVEAVAHSEKMSVEAARRLFDKNDPALQRGFWASLRKSLRPDLFVKCRFSTKSVEGIEATVRVTGTASGKEIDLPAFLERGGWRFGLIESS